MPRRPTSPPFPSKIELVANVVESPTMSMSAGGMLQDDNAPSMAPNIPIDKSW